MAKNIKHYIASTQANLDGGIDIRNDFRPQSLRPDLCLNLRRTG